jgi:hypothetical protein
MIVDGPIACQKRGRRPSQLRGSLRETTKVLNARQTLERTHAKETELPTVNSSEALLGDWKYESQLYYREHQQLRSSYVAIVGLEASSRVEMKIVQA